MLSQLSKGYGSWTAGYVDPYFGAKKAHEHHELSFPDIEHESHIHGVTVGNRSGRSTAMSWVNHKRSREPTLDGIPLPKTYTTRKGALQLYVGPDDLEDDDEDAEEEEETGYALKPKYVEIKRPHGQELINLSLKLGTMERLAMSVLQFGDQDYDHEHTSVSDAKNKSFLKFLHKVDEGYATTGVDSNVQPGGDLNNYLRDLKSSSSNHSGNMRISKSRESLELQAILRGLDNTGNWPLSYSQDGASERQSVGQFTRPVSRVSSRGASPGPPSTPRSSYQVLSAKKLCASIRSGSYLGRPSSTVSVNDDDDDILESDAGQVTSATICRPVWTPAESMDDSLLDARHDDTDSDGGKRRGKERSFLTNNSQLYKGRIARKGEGQRAGEVKVNSKGDGDSLSQRMTQIEEELGESSIFKRNNSVVSDYEQGPDTSSWAVKVTEAKHITHHEQQLDEGIHESQSSSIIDIEIDKKEHLDKVEVKVNSRPNSYKSDSSYSGSTSTHTPSIITLQSIHSPQKPHASQEKFKGLYKRRNTYCYDPDKGLVRAHNNMRRKSENNVHFKKNGGNMNHIANVRHENSPVAHTANRFINGPDFLHPDWAAYNNNNGHWPPNSNYDSDWPADGEEPNEKSYIIDDVDARNKLNKMVEDVIDNADTDTVQHVDIEDNIETAVIDQEEYVLDNIAECNAEVKQIEELAEGDEAHHDNDRYSDSGSSMDEELIKVILTGQTEKQEVKQIEPGIKDDIVEDSEIECKDDAETNEVVEDTDDVTGTEAFDSGEQVSAISEQYEENREVSEETQEQPESVISADVNGEDLEVVGIGQPSPVEDDLENVRQEITDETVDEENTSEVKSYRSGRSGRKSRSKRSKSGTGSEEDDDAVSVNEFSLPTLESDRLLGQEKDDSNQEGNQTINDEQTGFSGSTGSYSDILASNPNSRPATAAQSRPASSTKLSRPSSALARPTSAVKQEEKDDKTDKVAVDINSKSNNDAIDVAVKAGSKIDQIKISKTDDSIEEKREVVKLPEKAVVKDVEVKSLEIERNGAEVKDKEVKALKNDRRPSGAKVEEKKQPVPKAGKNVNERKTVGKQVTPGRGVPPKLPKSEKKATERDTSSKAGLNKTVLEGEGLLENISEPVSKLDPVSGDGHMEVDGDLAKVMKGHDNTDAHAIAAELDALGLRKKSKGELTYPLLAPGKRPKAPPEKAKIPDHIAEALNRQTDASIEYLEQDLERMTALVGETLSGPTLEAVGEGLTEEELELAKQILQQKLDEAKGTLDGKQPVAKVKGKKPAAGKPGKKGGKKGKGKSIEEEKSQEELDREAIREKHEQEKKMREQEAAELQKKIAEKQRMLKEQNDLSSARSKELQEEMERLEREAEAIQRAEDEAREILADVRKKQREERETRRKADLERKKQEALDRREREKKEMEDKRRKEMEMMEKIADAEMRRRMKEEEERRIDEEERLAQEKYEEEMREAQRMEEEEEERLKELERQAEEEAMQRLIEEREAAERERRRLREEEEALRDAENIRRQAMEEEHQRLEAERRKMQEAEDAKREAERQRLLELRRLEQEARIKMQEEIEKRRTDALARRDYNLENRQHVDKLRHYQGITRAWTFSYFVQWPRETYERPIGAGDPRKVVKINNPKPKKPADVPPESGEAPAPAIP